MPDTNTYADVKDPAVDLIALAAEDWAAATDWSRGGRRLARGVAPPVAPRLPR
jgi:hypothetical protein